MGRPAVFCRSRHMTMPIPFEFAYLFHDISYFFLGSKLTSRIPGHISGSIELFNKLST